MLVGDPRGEHLVTSTNGIWRYNVGTSTYVREATHNVNTSTLAGDPTFALASDGTTVRRLVGSTWVALPLPAPCTSASRVAGTEPTRLYAVATCNNQLGILWWDGAGLTLKAMSTVPNQFPTNLVVAPDGAVFVSTFSMVYRMDGSALTEVGPGSSMAALAADDVYVNAGNYLYVRYHAGQISTLRGPTNGAFVVSPRHIHIADGLLLRSLSRMPSRLGATGL
jgi:hypothetical protein